MALPQSAVSDLLDVLRTGEAVDLIRESVRVVMQELIEAEATQVIGAGRYERSESRVNERNGLTPPSLRSSHSPRSPARTGPKSGAPTLWSGSTRRSNGAPESWASSPTTTLSSASSARSWPACTTSGSQANAATSPKGPWPNSNRPAILTPTPRSTAARRHRGPTFKAHHSAGHCRAATAHSRPHLAREGTQKPSLSALQPAGSGLLRGCVQGTVTSAAPGRAGAGSRANSSALRRHGTPMLVTRASAASAAGTRR